MDDVIHVLKMAQDGPIEQPVRAGDDPDAHSTHIRSQTLAHSAGTAHGIGSTRCLARPDILERAPGFRYAYARATSPPVKGQAVVPIVPQGRGCHAVGKRANGQDHH